MHYFENYCTECDWRASTKEYGSHAKVGREAIDHHVESDHVIESRSLTYPHPLEPKADF